MSDYAHAWVPPITNQELTLVLPFDRRRFHLEAHKDTPTEGFDIVLQPISKEGRCLPIVRIRHVEQLKRFIEDTKQSNEAIRYLLLIEDCPWEVVMTLERDLDGSGGISSMYKRHVRGCATRNPFAPKAGALHSEKLKTTSFERFAGNIDVPSHVLTWWKLSSQNQEGQEHESEALLEDNADLSRFVAPILPSKSKLLPTSNDSREASKPWYKKVVQMSTGGIHPRMMAGLCEESIFRLDCSTYRPHHIITEVSDSMWGTACEERVSYINVKLGMNSFCESRSLT